MRVAGKTVTSDLLDPKKDGDDEEEDVSTTDDDSDHPSEPDHTVGKKVAAVRPRSIISSKRM